MKFLNILIIQLMMASCLASENQSLKAVLHSDQDFLYFSIINVSGSGQIVNKRMSWGGGAFNEIDLEIQNEEGRKYTDGYKVNIIAANKEIDSLEIKHNNSLGIQINIQDLKRRYSLKDGATYSIVANYKNRFRNSPSSGLVTSNVVIISLE